MFYLMFFPYLHQFFFLVSYLLDLRKCLFSRKNVGVEFFLVHDSFHIIFVGEMLYNYFNAI